MGPTLVILALVASPGSTATTTTATASAAAPSALSAEVETASEAFDLDALLGDLGGSLSEDELALLEDVEREAETATIVATQTEQFERTETQLRDPVTRNLEEGLITSLPLLRTYRGQRRRTVILDGIVLSPFSHAWLDTHPRLFSRAVVQPRGKRNLHSRGETMALLIDHEAPGESEGIFAEGAFETRTADRALLGHAGLAAASGIVAGRFDAAIESREVLRVASSTVGFDDSAKRLTIGGTFRVGAIGSALALETGWFFDGLFDASSASANGPSRGRYVENRRQLGFLRLFGEGDAFSYLWITGYQEDVRALDVRAGADVDDTARSVQSRADVEFPIGDFFRLRANALASLGFSASTLDTNHRRLEGGLGAKLALPRVTFDANARLTHQRYAITNLPLAVGDLAQEGTELVGDIEAAVELSDVLLLRVSVERGFEVGGDGVLAPSLNADGAERSTFVSLGPELRLERFQAQLIGAFGRLDHMPDAAGAVDADFDVYQLELRARFTPSRHVTFISDLAWAEVAERLTRSAAATRPSLRGGLTTQVAFNEARTRLQARIAGESRDLSVFSDYGAPPRNAYLQVGVSVSHIPLPGLELRGSVENLFDEPYGSAGRPAAGIDLRGQISYAF